MPIALIKRALLLSAALFALSGVAGTAGAAEFGGPANLFLRGKTLVAEFGEGSVEISILAGGIVQVEAFAPQIDSDFETDMIAPNAPEPAEIQFDGADSKIGGEGLEVALTPGDSFSLSISRAEGELLLALKPGGIAWEPSGSFSISFEKEKGDRLLGLGEPTPGLNAELVEFDHKRGRRPIFNRHAPPSDLGLPFIFNPRGYGLLIENPFRAEFDFTESGEFTYRAEGGPLRFYVIAGADGYEILKRCAQLTGQTPIPPYWTTGYMQSKYGYKDEAEFRGLMDNFRSHKLPADALIFDLDWFGENGMGSLWWSKKNFPDPERFQREMEMRGFKTITIVEPYIDASCANAEEVAKMGLAAQTAEGKPYKIDSKGGAMLLDYFNPEARRWWGEKLKRVHESGVDAWWTDLNEPESDSEDMVFHGGLPRKATHNLQAQLMHKAMADMYETSFPDERLFIMSRAGFVGDWRYGVGIWSGDVKTSWDHLESQIPIALSAGLSGYGIWNSDVGGFQSLPSAELYTRWMQFGAFCPIFRPHGDHTPREPWAFGEQAETDAKEIMELRYRLTPYTYTLFHELHAEGKPIMRPMFLEFPEDEEAYDQVKQYMFGPNLLVAPVVKKGETSKRVYLPEGVWTDFWTEKEVKGGRYIKAPAPLNRIPLFVREGAIVPMAPPRQYTGEKPVDPLTIHVFPGRAASTYALYEDDGATNACKRGQFALTKIAFEPGDSASLIVNAREGAYEGMPETRSYFVVWHGADGAKTVSLDAAAVPEASETKNASTSDPFWRPDKNNSIEIWIPPRAGGFAIQFAQ